MTFSNPAGNAPAAAQAYVRALLDLLGTRDPLAVMAELLPWLEQRLASVPEPVLRKPEAPGKWSVIQVVQQCSDVGLGRSRSIPRRIGEGHRELRVR